MKTPREILLGHHQDAEPKLDAVRRSTVAGLEAGRSAARAAIPRPSNLDPRRSWLSTLNSAVARAGSQLSTVMWPSPKAWAGLAAVWVVVVALNSMTRDEPKALAKQDLAPPSPQLLAALKEQRRLFVELLGLPEEREADGSKRSVPKSRSERPCETITA